MAKLCKILGELKDNLTSNQQNNSFFKPEASTASSKINEKGWEMPCLLIGILAYIPVIGWAILLIYFGNKTGCSDNENSLTN